jgi:metal-sulfur cluster biosynthetic enzyme
VVEGPDGVMSTTSAAPSLDDVTAALDDIVDPCSIGIGVPMSVREMGLVRHVAISPGGVVDVHLRMTSPGCHMGALVFEPAINERLAAVTGVIEVRVEFIEAVGWTENDIAPERRRQLVALRSRTGR